MEPAARNANDGEMGALDLTNAVVWTSGWIWWRLQLNHFARQMIYAGRLARILTNVVAPKVDVWGCRSRLHPASGAQLRSVLTSYCEGHDGLRAVCLSTGSSCMGLSVSLLFLLDPIELFMPVYLLFALSPQRQPPRNRTTSTIPALAWKEQVSDSGQSASKTVPFVLYPGAQSTKIIPILGLQ